MKNFVIIFSMLFFIVSCKDPVNTDIVVYDLLSEQVFDVDIVLPVKRETGSGADRIYSISAQIEFEYFGESTYDSIQVGISIYRLNIKMGTGTGTALNEFNEKTFDPSLIDGIVTTSVIYTYTWTEAVSAELSGVGMNDSLSYSVVAKGYRKTHL